MDARNIEFDSLLSVSREKAMKNREEARNYISIDLGNLARILSQYHPLELIKMAYWEERKVARTSKDESVKEAARMMPVVLQSVVQSTLFKPHSYLRDVKKKDWQRVQSICQDIQRKLNRYIDFQMVMEFLDGRLKRENLERYRAAVHHQFFPESASEEHLHMQTEFAKACLDGESPFFKEKFGISCEHLGNEIEKISMYAIGCIDRLRDDSSVHKTMMLLTMANLKTQYGNENKTDEELRLLALKEPRLRMENERLQGLRDDFDMFRPDFISDLPTSFYKELSAAPGTMDMDEYLFDKGLWPSASVPFIDFGGMYFTFMGKNLLGITQAVLKTRFGLDQRLAVASEAILSSVLVPTDVFGVYSYEGEKIDVETLCPLGEINAYRFPDLYESRIERRKAEMDPKPAPGHIALVLDPDGTQGAEKIAEGVFSTSLVHLLEIRNVREERIRFYRFILPDAGIDKLDEELEFSELEEDMIAPPADDAADDLADEVLTLDALDEPETVEEEDADDLAVEEPAPEISRYQVPEEEILENERIYNENREVILEALENEGVPANRDYLDKDLEDDYYQKPDTQDFSYEVEDEEEEAEKDLELTLDEEEEAKAEEPAAVDENEDDEDETDDSDQLDFLGVLDDEDLEDDTDEDEVFADEDEPIAPVENDVLGSEIETEKRDDDRIFNDEETPIAPVENEVLGSEIETEDRNDDDIEEESGNFPEAEIVEPVRDDDVVAEVQEEKYEQKKEKEPYVPDPAIMRKLFGLDDDDEKPEMETPHRDEEDKANETVASFFGFDDETEKEPVAEPVEEAPETDNNAEFFGLDDDSVSEPEEEDIDSDDEGPTFVLDDPSLVESEPAPAAPVAEPEPEPEPVEEQEETVEEDCGFSLFDPDEEEKGEEAEPVTEEAPADETPVVEEPEAEEEEIPESTSILLGGSEVSHEPETEEDAEEAESDDEDDDQQELPLFDEQKEESVQIPEMSDVIDLKDDDSPSVAAEAEGEESEPEELSGEGDALNGDIVLEYYDEDDKADEDEEEVSSETVLSDEKEADARERVFTMSEEDVRESSVSRTPASAYVDPVEEEATTTSTDAEEETHKVDLGNPKYSETIRQIASLLEPDLGVFGSFIEKEDRSVLDYFNTVIRQCWERQCTDGKDKMFSIFEYDMSILLAKSKVYDALRETELMNNAGAVMYSKGKSEWNALILYVNKDYKVESVELRKITKDDFSASNWKIVTVIGEELIARGQR